jgi:hypothetical protein
MILLDLKLPWTDSEVNMLLSYGRSLLSEQAALSYTWNPNNIRRLLNYEVIGNVDGRRHIITPNIESRAAAQHLIYNLWLEAPNTYPLVLVTGLNFKPEAGGITFFQSIAAWRGSLITRKGLLSYPELAVAHELVHGFGLLDDRWCAGAWGFLMSRGPCGFGRELMPGQVIAVRINSLTLR